MYPCAIFRLIERINEVSQCTCGKKRELEFTGHHGIRHTPLVILFLWPCISFGILHHVGTDQAHGVLEILMCSFCLLTHAQQWRVHLVNANETMRCLTSVHHESCRICLRRYRESSGKPFLRHHICRSAWHTGKSSTEHVCVFAFSILLFVRNCTGSG